MGPEGAKWKLQCKLRKKDHNEAVRIGIRSYACAYSLNKTSDSILPSVGLLDWRWPAVGVIVAVLAIPVAAADLVLELRPACVISRPGGCIIAGLTWITLLPGVEIVSGRKLDVSAVSQYRQGLASTYRPRTDRLRKVFAMEQNARVIIMGLCPTMARFTSYKDQVFDSDPSSLGADRDLYYIQWLNCHWTQGNAVLAPTII